MGGATAAARLALPPTYTEAELTRMKDLIYKWKRVGVPPHWANWVNDQTGISRHELCPTVFRPED
jgi:hypothetical protein